MPTAKKILKGTLIVTGTLVAALVVATVVMERRTYDAAYPAITARTDQATVERGRYLVEGPAHCTECHGAKFGGGLEFKLPVGTIRAANISSDRETGIGAARDEEIARALRFGVGRNGRALPPFMPFADLSDEDLTAIVSYLRTQPAVHNPVTTKELNPLGHAVVAFVFKPQGPSAPPPARLERGPTVEYGRYLVNNVANCTGCHSKRDMRTGAFIGEKLAGGLEMDSDTVPGRRFVSPNLTPDPSTGRITNWTEEVFVARVQTGKGAEGSPMPWASFGRMSENDLRAVYRYLRSLRPVNNPTGDSVLPVVASK